ncbi:DUF6891 domain-containing protein [Nocardiopsis valliformis]|uniref:DUF6891 domain-containing protein n=1 Tax=Nocardiopsis valliformis TaxID=239974 RepID=UPI00036DE2DD|nr:hypothetical protein [Nocardiopsis valliformis]
MSDDWSSGESPFDDFRERVAVMVAVGRLGFSEVLERAYDRLLDHLRSPTGRSLFDEAPADGAAPGKSETDRGEAEELRARATEVYDFVDQSFAKHLRTQRRWSARTDVERLERAGQALAGIGTPLFEAFDCCDGCLEHHGGEEFVWRYADRRDARARSVVYFFESDIELALLGGGLWVSFAAREQNRTQAAATEILEVLHAHGLDAVWPDESVPRIRVDMEWRCRRRGRLAAHPGPRADREPGIRVRLTNALEDRYVPWWGEHSFLDPSVREFSRIALPWLPTGYQVEVTSHITGDALYLERDFDRIRVLGTVALLGPILTMEPERLDGLGRKEEEDLLLPLGHLEEILGRWAVDGSLPFKGDTRPVERGLLDVCYDDGFHLGAGTSALGIPMDLAECRSLMYRVVPVEGAFVVAHAFNGVCVQMVWQENRTVWMETPDPARRVSHGRLGTLAEVEELFCQLAEEGTSGLLGRPDVHVISWD